MPGLTSLPSETINVSLNDENLIGEQGANTEDYFPKEDRVMHNKIEQHDRVNNKQRRIYSSTSSVYAEHTISDPNNDQVLYW